MKLFTVEFHINNIVCQQEEEEGEEEEKDEEQEEEGRRTRSRRKRRGRGKRRRRRRCSTSRPARNMLWTWHRFLIELAYLVDLYSI